MAEPLTTELNKVRLRGETARERVGTVTLNEMREAKKECEEKVLAAVQAFVEQTGLTIEEVALSRHIVWDNFPIEGKHVHCGRVFIHIDDDSL